MTNDFWTVAAQSLADALLKHPDELLRHFVVTASAEEIERLAGPPFAVGSANTKASIRNTLVNQLAAPKPHGGCEVREETPDI